MKRIFLAVSAALALALTVATPARVTADAGDALVGGIIGGVIGGAIVNENNKRKAQTKRVYRQPAYSAERAVNRERMGQRVPFGGSVALAIGEVFQDRGHRPRARE